MRAFLFAAALALAATPAAAQDLTKMGSSLLKTCTSNWNGLSALQKGKIDSQSFISACMTKQNPTSSVLGGGSGASALTSVLGTGALGTSALAGSGGGSTSGLLNSLTGGAASSVGGGCADKWSALSTTDKARFDQRSFLAGCAAR
ncbi:hypothetical protein PMI01_00484 [Caulobacter sp. AP07]|uniref:hypothetical protein n=1 Tax=Caulobacter sp. AP07 TaxID=1144304 RepID=UPI000271D998|nr:hypothetical protein [Caulobacter sp. AP07]EJL37818.1 hypothetical protein PMI01_00484 [Caulobacter sp. AP07]